MLIRAIEHTKPQGDDTMLSIAAREWLAEGEAKGIAKGKAEGTTQGKADILLRRITRRFGPQPPEVETRIRSADNDSLDIWADRILDSPDLDAVFGNDRAH